MSDEDDDAPRETVVPAGDELPLDPDDLLSRLSAIVLENGIPTIDDRAQTAGPEDERSTEEILETVDNYGGGDADLGPPLPDLSMPGEESANSGEDDPGPPLPDPSASKEGKPAVTPPKVRAAPVKASAFKRAPARKSVTARAIPVDPDKALRAAIRSHRQGDLETAAAGYRHVLSLNPGSSAAWINLGVLLRRRDHIDAAVICLRRGVALNDEDGSAWSNLGNALRAANRLEEAKHAQTTALDLTPGAPQIHYNLGLVHRDLGNLPAATDCFRRAELLGYDKPDLAWDQALTLLLGGDMGKGFDAYESRWKLPESPPRHTSIPRWEGEDDPGKTILVHYEQGLGDTLQFCRYVPLLTGRAGKIVFEVQPALIPLLRNSPGFEAVEFVERGRPVPPCDTQIPLLSLPRHFPIGPDVQPDDTPYIRAPADRPRLPRAGLTAQGLRVGLVWAGKPTHRNDRNRSIPLVDFARLLDMPRVAFFGLQPGPEQAQISASGLDGIVRDCSGLIGDFNDTAALLNQLDLLISVDTSVAHLAGALGRPVWTLLPFSPDWRWQLRRDTSPWYPTMKLFRQTSPGDWDEVITRVRQSLASAVQKPHETA